MYQRSTKKQRAWPAAGDRVSIQGMHPDPNEFNGKTGTVLGKSHWPDCYMVKLDDANEPAPVHILKEDLDSL